MKTDIIKEIKIDGSGRLCIFPEKEKFTQIYRLAVEVHWDNEKLFLYSPKPREWSYLDWYNHITSLVRIDYGIDLLLTANTTWINIPSTLKEEIIAMS